MKILILTLGTMLLLVVPISEMNANFERPCLCYK